MLQKLIDERNPLIVGLLFTIIGAILILVTQGTTPWLVLMISLLFYAIISEIIGLRSTQWLKHTAISFAVFVGMAILLGYLANISADTPLKELTTFKKMLVLVVFSKILLTGLATLFRTVFNLIKEID